ncbi:hypothetical protein OG436_39745 (plasmid) [Streptomyces caniferus]|uniref:hypothetical protein n=1 Tax=Streptomyces caniferus TaxID=285557 RepID=UPI002E29BD90|nr:hypothetical protein [Streptomyces caniferus]
MRRILPVDPNSACQRLFNAAVRDLRDKILIVGVGIAGEAARAGNPKLPPIQNAEDVEHYSTFNLIKLAYRIGLLTRAEWRKMTRVYDIRKDLEHEDSEYEAVFEDVVYTFATCIDAVLSKDPITLIEVSEVKQIIEASGPIALDTRLLTDFEHAPDQRQQEIVQVLVSTALSTAPRPMSSVRTPTWYSKNCATSLGTPCAWPWPRSRWTGWGVPRWSRGRRWLRGRPATATRAGTDVSAVARQGGLQQMAAMARKVADGLEVPQPTPA